MVKHSRSNNLISFELYDVKPIDKRKEQRIQLVITYYTLWVFEGFFDSTDEANAFIERHYKDVYALCEDKEHEIWANREVWARQTRESLELFWQENQLGGVEL